MRRLDPARSNSSTVAMSARPGNTASHHMPADRYAIDSLRITPMAGCSGGRPKPRNVTAASCRMACGNSRINPTMNWGST